jgi:adenylate cyclase
MAMTSSSPVPFLVLESTGRSFPLASGSSWAIGRADGCMVMLDSRSVSRLHALIQRRETGELSLVDLGSRNGSFVNGRRVSFPVTLKDADKLVFGDQELLYRNPERNDSVFAASGQDLRNAPTTAMHTKSLTTILVVDIRDFTVMSRSLPEALLAQTIGTFFLRSGQILQRLGSWAQKYIGDAVMAVWVHEVPGQVGAEVLRVMQAVKEINLATAEVSRSLALPSPMRIGAGVNTGPAILGGTDNTALGDTVNAAFRLETATKGLGVGIAVGDRVYEELPLRVQMAFTRRPVILKGYADVKECWAISFDGLSQILP